MVRVINHLGNRLRHTIIALDNDYGAAARLAPNVDLDLAPRRRRVKDPLRASLGAILLLRRLRPDLLLTYNWGSVDWAIAHRLAPIATHIHFESGFGKEEADTQLWRRVRARRWALANCTRLVVPSRQLEMLARQVWKLPAGMVTYLPNGVDLERFNAPPRDTIPGFTRRPGEIVIGTVAPLRPEKNIGRLLRVFARLADKPNIRLIVAGDGVERRALDGLARELGITDRIIFTGEVQPETVLGTFDIFTLSSDTEQMPNALLEAMAASRAVVAVDVGDVKAMVCEQNRDFIVPRDDTPAFATAIRRLLGEHMTRDKLGLSNRQRAAAEFSQQKMFADYARLFCGAERCGRTSSA